MSDPLGIPIWSGSALETMHSCHHKKCQTIPLHSGVVTMPPAGDLPDRWPHQHLTAALHYLTTLRYCMSYYLTAILLTGYCTILQFLAASLLNRLTAILPHYLTNLLLTAYYLAYSSVFLPYSLLPHYFISLPNCSNVLLPCCLLPYYSSSVLHYLTPLVRYCRTTFLPFCLLLTALSYSSLLPHCLTDLLLY